MKKIAKLLFSLLPFKKQVFSVLKIIFHPREKIYRHLYFKDIFKVRVNGSHSFKMKHYGFQLENDIFWKGLTGRWEKRSMQTWIDLSRNSRIVMDIGANTGVYSLVTKSVNPAAKILAFEPVKRVFDKLETNMQLNNFNVSCYNWAVSDHNGKATFYDTNEEHTYTITLDKDLSANKNYHPVDVDIITIDEIIQKERLGGVDLIKIDVETHEPEVFKGFSLIKEYHPAVLVEVLTEEIGNRIEKILNQWGCNYLYFDIDEEKGIRQVDHIGKSAAYNYLLCTAETARKINLIS